MGRPLAYNCRVPPVSGDLILHSYNTNTATVPRNPDCDPGSRRTAGNINTYIPLYLS